ncbi:hypothetical protein M7I_6278 [Glarea lozoyensis 74030]|uniref:Uncharacterized protein n=1 Tax=Glarea lozoyensis (strain ATCC 74030 / MF5533) TaxID=1104152 RepID=H0EU49_GLAL7|nr:hypothetical protein M7I_6278 [Glarea lozoyensis 74030]
METLPNSQDVKIQSNFDELGSLIVRKSDMDQWLREAVFCHNDLTPRNLILKKWDLPGGKKKYKFLECLGLTRDDDPYAGWTPERKEGKIVDFSSTAMQRLKDDIVQEMEERRKSKAK